MAPVMRALPFSIVSFEVEPRFRIPNLNGLSLCVESFDIVFRFRNASAHSSLLCVESLEIVFRFDTSVMPRALCGLDVKRLPDSARLTLEESDASVASWEKSCRGYLGSIDGL